jgi:hypothetical protein
MFPSVGKLYQGKSGNPESEYFTSKACVFVRCIQIMLHGPIKESLPTSKFECFENLCT